MKVFKKVLALTLSLLTASSLLACDKGGDSTDNGGNGGSIGTGSIELKISPFNGGYGLDWLDAISAEFVKENPDVKVVYNKTTVKRSDQVTALKSGTADADLYITGLNIHTQINNQLPIVELTDIYNEVLSSKIIDSVENWYSHDGKQYGVPWGTATLGVLYHKDYFAENNIQVPRTTNELIAAAQKITELGKNGSRQEYYAFSYSDNEDTGECYWDYLFNPWLAQYEGIANYEKYWDGKLKDGSVDDSGAIASEYKGVLRTLEVYEEILNPSNNFNHKQSKDDDFTTAQFRFLDGETKMMFNGDWIVQEMVKSNSYTKEETADVAFMRAPIISSMVETMPMWTEAENVHYTTDPTSLGEDAGIPLSAERKAAYEKALVAIIDYVDGVTNVAPTNVDGIIVSEEDIARVREARSITPSMSDSHIMVIPTCSDQIELAKKFIKFMYSPKGIELYSANVYGTGLPINYSEGEIQSLVGDSALLKSAYSMLGEGSYLTFYSGGKNSLFTNGGLKPTFRSDGKSFIECMTASAASNYEGAYTFYNKSVMQIITAWDTIYSKR